MSVAYWAGYPKSYTPGRARAIQYIVIHITVGPEGPNSAENGHQYDTTRTDGVSTHVFVDSNSVAREVPDGDRAHAARFHGNEIGLQMEICGYVQTAGQWADATSQATLKLAAKMAAEWCTLHSIPVRRLSVNEVRAAYYNSSGSRPKGICGHVDVTYAYPEDGGTHTDPGPEFPWSQFLQMVKQELAPTGGDVPKTFTINEEVPGLNGPISAGALYASGGAGFFHINDPDDATFYGQTWGIDPFATGNPMPLEEAHRRFGPFLGEYNQLAAGPKGDKGDDGIDGEPGAGFAPGQTVTVTGTVTVQ